MSIKDWKMAKMGGGTKPPIQQKTGLTVAPEGFCGGVRVGGGMMCAPPGGLEIPEVRGLLS